MGKKIDLTGQLFGQLTVVSEGGRSKDGTVMWNCNCTCGKQTTVQSCALRRGTTVSCGCYHKEQTSKLNRKHGLYQHPLYRVYNKMKARCYDPDQHGYYRYGGRGIKVCERWLESFENFFKDVSIGYQESLELDRRDNDGDYEPNNIRWVTKQQNKMNRSGNIGSTSKYKGVSWDSTRDKWVMQISKDGIKISTRFDDEVAAARKYNLLAAEMFGEFANLNKLDDIL